VVVGVTLAAVRERVDVGRRVGPGRLVELVVEGSRLQPPKCQTVDCERIPCCVATDSHGHVLQMSMCCFWGISVPSKTWPTQIVLWPVD